MRKSVYFTLALSLLPGLAPGAEKAIDKGGGFVWMNIQGLRTPGHKLKSDDVIQFSGYSLRPPPPRDWKVLRKGPYPRGVGFSKRDSDKISLVWAASFVLALDESTDGIVRGLVGQPYWNAPEGFRVLSATGNETTRDSTRCVRVSATALKTSKGSKAQSGVDFKAECLACSHPTAPTLQVVLMYAERKPSRSAWTSRPEDAEQFFSSLKFSNLTTPIEENFALPGPPFVLEFLEGYLWVGLGDEGTVLQVDPRTGEILEKVELPGPPKSMSAGHGALWVIASDGDIVYRISPSSNEVEARIKIPIGCRKVVTGAGSSWVICGSDHLLRIDPQTNSVVATIKGPWLGKKRALNPLPAVLTGMVYSEPWLWVADGEHSRVFRIDPQTNRIATDPIKVGRRPVDLAATDRAIWTANRLSESVSQVDRESGEVLGEVKVDGEPIVAIAHAGTVWVSNPYLYAVTQIDTTATGPTGHPIWAGIRPTGLAIHGDYLWIADGLGNILSKVRIAVGSGSF